ncbi:hypothetical protein MTBUT4_100130 [Magnetospirillum sp. UT-4]|nr:hypothetical protein MTBUT4_100130 [Magnetospirillum sp. UT-4]
MLFLAQSHGALHTLDPDQFGFATDQHTHAHEDMRLELQRLEQRRKAAGHDTLCPPPRRRPGPGAAGGHPGRRHGRQDPPDPGRQDRLHLGHGGTGQGRPDRQQWRKGMAGGLPHPRRRRPGQTNPLHLLHHRGDVSGRELYRPVRGGCWGDWCSRCAARSWQHG